MIDALRFDPADAPHAGRTDWLADRLRAAIADGSLAAGSLVPPSRELASDLGFARGTVVEAYQRLIEETLLTPEPRRGIRVAGSSSAVAMPHAAGTAATPAGETSALSTPGRVDLAHGIPDITAFPRAAWLRAEREVLSSAGVAQLGYPPAAGAIELRTALSAWLHRSRGVVVDPAGIIVTGGVAGALSLLAQVLPRHGHSSLALEDPSNTGTRDLLEHWMPRTPGIPVDEDGLDVAALRHSGAGAVLVTPAHQYPTGVVLAPERRRALLAWAEHRDGLVIEDDYDAEHRYDRRPVRALQPLAPARVAYASSLSKTLTPALRVGWLVPPRALHADLVELRHATDLGAPAIPQLVLASLLERGVIERHLRTVRLRHRRRRDALVTGLRTARPQTRIGGIAAGLHLVVETADDARVAQQLAADGIDVLALSALSIGAPTRSGLVLHYGGQSEAVLADAGARIARALR